MINNALLGRAAPIGDDFSLALYWGGQHLLGRTVIGSLENIVTHLLSNGDLASVNLVLETTSNMRLTMDGINMVRNSNGL